MGLKVTNNAFGTLNAGINSTDTVIVLEAGQGARFPVLSAGDYFYATLIDTSNQLEIVKVTARATDTMTVVRAQDGTSSRAYNVNDRFELRPTAALFNEKVNKSGDTMTGDLIINTTGALTLPDGTTGQRPSAASGMVRLNNDTSQFEGYNGTAWGSLGGGATGGGADQVFVENDQAVTANYTIPATKNALSTGPITINDGVTVTVNDGARYVVL